MKEIKITYFVERSKRPSWLLGFLSQVRPAFGLVAEDCVYESLRSISNMLDEHTYTQRTLKRSCANIRREIEDNKMSIYSSTGQTLLATILFE